MRDNRSKPPIPAKLLLYTWRKIMHVSPEIADMTDASLIIQDIEMHQLEEQYAPQPQIPNGSKL